MKLRNKKTGVIGELSGVNRIVVYEPDMPLCGNSILGEYDTLAELNKDWEDYEPTEPLIKDPKIRKAVRAWAEANDIEDGITYLDNGEFRSYLNTTIDFAILVDEHRFDLLKKSEEYTVTELCGEEG